MNPKVIIITTFKSISKLSWPYHGHFIRTASDRCEGSDHDGHESKQAWKKQMDKHANKNVSLMFIFTGLPIDQLLRFGFHWILAFWNAEVRKKLIYALLGKCVKCLNFALDPYQNSSFVFSYFICRFIIIVIDLISLRIDLTSEVPTPLLHIKKRSNKAQSIYPRPVGL